MVWGSRELMEFVEFIKFVEPSMPVSTHVEVVAAPHKGLERTSMRRTIAGRRMGREWRVITTATASSRVEATARGAVHGAGEFGIVELGVVAVLVIIRFTMGMSMGRGIR